MTLPSLKINKLIDASCKQVFAAWSQPEIMQQWLFPPKPQWHATVSNEFALGGHFSLAMIDGKGTIYKHSGIYREIIAYQKIVFTWNSDAVKDTLITVELLDISGKTQLTLTHEFFSDLKICETHQTGWQEILINLATHFNSGFEQLAS